MKKRIVVLIVATVFAALWGLRFFNMRRHHVEKKTAFLMDTYVTIVSVGPKERSLAAIEAALKRMEAVDEKFNPRNPKSPLYGFNKGGQTINDEEVLRLLRIALKVSDLTEGAYDITTRPLTRLWGFDQEVSRKPSNEEIREVLAYVGPDHIFIAHQKGLVKSRPEVEIDLGSVAKGYAVAQAIEILKGSGIRSAVIDVGGDIYALGKKGSAFWKVGIQDPRRDQLLGYLEVENLAVMGTGDYERFFYEGNERYHHIFNPQTGTPAQGLSGITVIHPDPVQADIWATALFVMGPSVGLAFVEGDPQMEAVFVTDSGDVIYSSGLKGALKIVAE